MEPPSPTPPSDAANATDTADEAHAVDVSKGLPVPVWVAGVIVILGLLMWLFQR